MVYHLDFMKKGLLLPLDSSERRNALFPNCTMACYNPFNPKHKGKFVDIAQTTEYTRWKHILNQSDNMTYGVRSDAYVLNCWDYIVVKDAVGKKDDVLDMYSSYLTNIFQAFTDYTGKGHATFRIIIDDFKCLGRYFAKGEVFDRISISSLSDYYYFPLLLEQFGSWLNSKNDCSVLITHHENWVGMTGVYQHVTNAPQRIVDRGLKDVKQRPQVLDGVVGRELVIQKFCMCIEEYFDTTPYLLCSLLSEVVAYTVQNDNLPLAKALIKHPSSVAQGLGLRLRNYCCELNHVVPFKRQNNTRFVSLQMNNKRYLEWTIRGKAIPVGQQ